MANKWVHICLYTFIYLHIPSYTPEYLYMPLYTPIYIKISNIRKMRSDIRPTNCLKCGPRGSPMARIWHARYYHTVKGFFTKRTPILIKLKVFEGFGGVIKLTNPINRGPCTSFKGGRALPLKRRSTESMPTCSAC